MARLAPLWQQNNSYSAQVDRQILAALWPNGGAVGVAPSAVANTLNVNVPAGRCAVPILSDGTVQLCRWDTTEVVALNPGPGAGTSRIDLIAVNPRDSAIAGTNDDFQIVPLTGTAAAAPVPPNLLPNSYALTSVLVPASVANLNTATLTDLRTPLAVPQSAETMLTSVIGPASTQSGQGEFGIAVANFPARVGHAYRATAYVLVAVSSGVGRCVSRLTSTSGVVPFASTYLVAGVTPTPPNVGQAGTAVVWARATADGNGQVTLAIAGDGSAVAIANANVGRILIEDMGPWPAGAALPVAEDINQLPERMEHR